ncbi:fibronectin type III domain-containing protein [Homoserinibacter sp. YIM 151385]|uniref:fibronectin type III domain-containing protein n=1 Tax=Homoserinibacter sp. YIM 151385 TaxID=2985506 RepID=UPI0022F09C1B|nr:fibronectin type III domain-containing protein [Homoserinibacter sp. YIM 151385]WBU37748.1 fibronectin type III domain-containing protein [Homoserinibacter sp. YIM 151385]
MPLSLSRRALVALAAVLTLTTGLLLVPAGAAHAASTLDQENLGPREATATNSVMYAQTFTAGLSGRLVEAQFSVVDDATGALQLMTVRDGNPDALLATAVSAGSADGLTSWTFDPAPPVTAGTRYALVVPSGGLSATVMTREQYPRGAAVVHHEGAWRSFEGWYDFRFRTFVDATPPTVAGGSFEARRDVAVSGIDLGVTPSTAVLALAPGSDPLPAGLRISGHTISGTPTESVTRTVRVRATNDGIVADADVTLAVRGVPSAVRGLRGTGLDGAVGLSWDAPQDAGNGGMITYRIVVAEVGGDPIATYWTGGRQALIDSLDNAKRYRVEIVAMNAQGGGFGPPESLVVDPPAAPSAPREPVVEGSDGAIAVSWGAPASDGGSPILGYEASIRGGDWRQVTSPLVVDGVNGEPIEVLVRARNRARHGSSLAVSGTPRTVPGAPEVRDLVPQDGAMELEWSAPASDGGAAITGYVVEHRAMGESRWTASAPSPASARSARVTGLENGVRYEIRVLARNGAGDGRPSGIWSTKPLSAPGAPRLELAGQGDGTIELRWRAPALDGGSPVTGWTLEVRAADEASWRAHAAYGSAARTATVQGLRAGTDYLLRLRAVNEAGAGAASEAVEARVAAAAGAPAALAARPLDGALALSWEAPAQDGGSPVTGYEIAWTAPGLPRSEVQTVTGTSARIEGLANGTPVTVRVSAVTAAGRGEAASVVATPFILSPVLLGAGGSELASVAAGGTIVVADTGLPEGTRATAELHSTPVELGEARVGADGRLRIEARVPATTEPGRHTVVLRVEVPGAGVSEARIPLRVTAAGSAAESSDGSVAAVLAATGGDAAPLGLAALLLLALGASLLRRGRRAGVS